MQTEVIRLENVSKTFDNTEEVLKSISLSIKKNEFFTLLGPSGCGKTTILRIMGGFLSPSSGNVFFDGKNITNLPPNKRELNTVFQKYALFPHMNVYENIAFGLKVKKVPGDEIKRRTLEMLSVVNLEGFEKRDVTSLSGGQQQRVAIARALVNNPKLLLLDEPLGALDLKMRKDMQLELKRIQQKMGITFVYVTHDQEEALTMSDTIVVMNKGEIQQQGTPVDIYNEPKNAFVADFIGESNIVPGVMEKDFLVKFQGRAFNCVDKGFLPNENIDVVIRPEDIKIVQPENAMLTGVVKSSIFKGVHYEMLIECDGTEWMVHSTLTEEPGKNVGMVILPNDIHIMKKTTA